MGERKWRQAESLLQSMGTRLQEGMVPSKIFNDPEIFELEKERVFTKAWVFLGHESEIPNPGDYVVRYIVDDSFIVIRDEDSNIQVFFNSCSHRGMQICNVEMGNTSHFRCPYHGWTFKNNGKLVGIPFGNEVYGKDGLKKDQWGLRCAPKFDCYNGLIFACLDANAVSLDEYLGDFKWYLDIYLKKSEAGMEVIGAPQRWIVDADWKLGADNFIGDGYHTATSHRSTVDVGVLPVPGANFHKNGVQVYADPGGVGLITLPPQSFMGYPESIVESMKRSLKPEQFRLLSGEHFQNQYSLFQTHGGVFPNLSFLNAPGSIKPGGPPIPYLTIRIWNPIGPGKMEVWSWFLVEKDAPEWFKEASYRAYVLSFGSSGTLEQDDTENWRSITRVAKGTMAKNHFLNYQMGMATGMQPLSDWPGPGVAYPIAYIEANQRAFFAKWFQYMCQA
ncbi:large subunit of biphenyl dioxygenase (plasmid) [Geobacillus genomosp. 3]|uniref:Large subunit of biphenyl dioxygenase n=1 Tax=Geobacillus genomosp. 3 TaxID=1921421 RepID=Q7WZF1_GEOG3|nr:Rieske 2Fe-2S domain-containing protein [Geobacillus genomosp. 3]AGT33881.1 large subunit of biphenyl dioxygenase [Geobacillus genomosp. 3]BAC79226.1 large subunit of biphenyl dioxygenase [Geobacillus genomosp. 3]